MNVALMQPSFLPWQGYFELIYQSQVFVFLDDLQFSVQSYHQRNRLFVNKDQIDWYTIPVQKAQSFQKPLNEVSIAANGKWLEKTWKRIVSNYSKADYFETFSSKLEKWLFEPTSSLAAKNISFILLACQTMGLEREFRFSTQFHTHETRSQRVAQILNWCGATRYYCAYGSFAYMKEDGVFPLADVDVLFQNFIPRAYSQIGATSFQPFLSIVDAFFNIGPANTLEYVRTGTSHWLSWQDRAASLDVHNIVHDQE